MRRLLSIFSLAALSACTDPLSTDCLVHQTDIAEFTMPSSDPPTQLRLDSCRIDRDACMDLCALVLQRDHVPVPPTGCAVEFAGATVRVLVPYATQRLFNGGCAVEGFG